MFSEYFFSTFLSSDPNESSDLPPNVSDSRETECTHDINNIEVREEEVLKLLLNLDTSKSAGPDDLSPIFLTGCAKSIYVPISLLFSKSMSEGTLPKIWKSAFVSPIHKKGSKTEVVNYRPISKLCIIAKLFERIVYNQIYAALRHSFSVTQHGFLKGRSTASNLVLLNDILTEAMDSGFQVDVIYTDYSKAFDRIDHRLLLSKLYLIGIRGDLLRWFSSYIRNRSQAIVINNYISSWISVPSGVPQGSLLGPLLFLIFVNDIENCFQNSQLLSFADDMKIFRVIKSIDDVAKLQSDLMRLENYCVANKLDLNPSKCSVTTFTRKRNPIPSSYILKHKSLQRSSVVRDLGVLHDSKLLFDKHVDAIISKASRSLGFIMRSSASFTRAKTFKVLYCSFVRSILEYASQVWNPRYNTYIDRIERIQVKFMKYLCFRLKIPYKSLSYDQLCRKFHFLPLSTRREIADLIFLLKITSNKIDCPELLTKISLRAPSKVVRYNPIIFTPSVGTNYRQNSFLWRAGDRFNNLCRRIDLDLFCTSVHSARQRLSSEFFLTD